MEVYARIKGTIKNSKKMKEEDYKNMVSMLIRATNEKKIKWTETSNPALGYTTEVGGCRLKIWSVYDMQLDDSSYGLSLANPDGKVFSTYSFSEMDNSDDYVQLAVLYNAIRDVVYRISESEILILKGLQNLVDPDND